MTRSVPSAQSADRSRRLTSALRPPRVLEYAVVVVVVLTVLVDVTTSIPRPDPLLRLLVLAVTVGGFALAWWRPWPGLVLMTMGPLLSIPFGVRALTPDRGHGVISVMPLR